jgi:hypothetical protein
MRGDRSLILFSLATITIELLFLHVAVCSQFSRGVFSMLGAVSPDSFDTLHSYSNTFQMPFVTPWFPEKVNTRLVSSSSIRAPQGRLSEFLLLPPFTLSCLSFAFPLIRGVVTARACFFTSRVR